MSDPSVIKLLIVERSRPDIDHIVKTLRGDGYQLDLIHTDQAEEARSAIDYQPLDLILLRLADNLPSLAEIRLMVAEVKQDIPIIAVVDDYYQRYKPARLLEEGADNYFYLDDADHLVAVIRKELRHLQERKRERSFETRFRESENRSQVLLESLPEALAYIHEGVHVYANPPYLHLFGYERQDELANLQLVQMVPPSYRDTLKNALRRSIRSGKAVDPIELVGVRSDGQTFPMLLECAPTRMNDEPCTQVIVRENRPEKIVYARPSEDLRLDDMSGLYNRRFLLETMESKRSGALLYILLTDYAAIRYAMGFETIEQFTRETADLVKALLESGDIAAHFASGVFAVYLPANSPTDPLTLAERIRGAIAGHSFKTGGKLFTTTCCIGVYKAGSDQETATQILSYADRACETARQRGGNQVEVYAAPPAAAQERLGAGAISEEDEAAIRLIRDALTRGRLSLLYQPIVSFENAEEERYKVYLRILDDAETARPVDQLGSVAVRYGLMSALDKWTLIRGLSVLFELQKVAAKLPALFIRISRNSITDKEFMDWLGRCFKDGRLSPDHLVLEIKEDDADECFEETRQLRTRLKALGCGMALSHFGGKADSDRLLRDLMPDYIKLDGSLIEQLVKTKDENSRRSMAVLAQQAQELRIRVAAAGVATAPQMAGIWQFGVTLVQGDMVAEASANPDFNFQQYAD